MNWRNELFLILEKQIQLGDGLKQRLSFMKEPFAQKLLDFLESDNIKDDANVSKVDYFDKDGKSLTIYDENGKPRIFKLTKFLQLLGYDMTHVKPYEIDLFINYFKDIEIEKDRLRLVKGKDILDSYNCKNYRNQHEGSLNISCMRHDYTQKYLKIYTDNPNQVSCLTYYSENDKVEGRALIWNLDNGMKLMDRIYTLRKEDESIFIDYAKKNKIEIKENDSYTVTLDNGGEFEYYPYMDTLMYYIPDENLLCSKIKNNNDKDCLELRRTDGTAKHIGNGTYVYSEWMNEDIIRDEAVFSYYMDSWIYKNDAIKIFYGDSTDYMYYQYEDNYEITCKSEKYEHLGDFYALEEDCIKINNKTYVLKEDTDVYVEIKGKYYLNGENVYEDIKEVAYKDSFGNFIPQNDIISIWSKKDDDIIALSKKSKELKDIKTYNKETSYEVFEYNGFPCHIPKSFMTQKDGYDIVSPNAPIVVIDNNVYIVRDKRKKLYDGFFVGYHNKSILKTKVGDIIFLPFTETYYNDDIPFVQTENNPYKNYNDYLDRMEKLKEYSEKDDNYKIEDYLKSYEYYQKVLKQGNIIADYFKGYKPEIDTIFLTTQKNGLDKLKKFVYKNTEEFNFEDYLVDYIEYHHATTMGLYYDTPKYKVYPFFYNQETSENVVYNKALDKYEFMTLQNIKQLA